MVGSAVFGAAAGTGLALVVAMTIVLYRYYYSRKQIREWSSLDSLPLREANRKGGTGFANVSYSSHGESASRDPQMTAQSVITDWGRSSMEAESSVSSSHNLQHQSKSCPPNQSPSLCRTPSMSSQSSVESISRPAHRGSSPQIRTFAPDGRSLLHGETAFPTRSSSPMRAASFDARTEDYQHQFQRTTIGRSLSPLHLSSAKTALEPELAVNALPTSPLGAIQPDLYLSKQEPMYLRKNPNEGQSLGKIHFRLKYDFDRSDLVVHLIGVKDLFGGDQGGFNDPYVKVNLQPEVDTKKRQVDLKKNEPNSVINESFKFPISYEELQNKTLLMQVLDYDRLYRSDTIGEVHMSMEKFNVPPGLEIFADIIKTRRSVEELQEILISLSYLPGAERLTVVVLKAKNLFLHHDKEELDPFVKVYLLINEKRTKKKKTAARKGSCNPMWNEALTFSLPFVHTSNASIEICVMDQSSDLMSTSPLIGCCVIGPKEIGSGRDHWIDMMQSPRKAVAYWHVIK